MEPNWPPATAWKENTEVFTIAMWQWTAVALFGRVPLRNLPRLLACWWMLMAEIPNNHLGSCWNPKNNGINYQPQLVSRISAINSMTCRWWLMTTSPPNHLLLGCSIPRWWFQIFFYVHPKHPQTLGKWSNLTSIFLRWVGSTTNQIPFPPWFFWNKHRIPIPRFRFVFGASRWTRV